MLDRIVQYLLGGLFLASGCFMAWFASAEGDNLPGGKLAFYGMAGFFLLVAWVILVRFGRMLAARLIGVVIFGVFGWYAFESLGTDDSGRALAGLFALGLPALYAALTYKLPHDPPQETDSPLP